MWWLDKKSGSVEAHDVFKHTKEWTELLRRTQPSERAKMGKYVDITRDEIIEFGHNAEETILLCELDNQPCSYKEFKTIQNSRYGNCFTFNHG